MPSLLGTRSTTSSSFWLSSEHPDQAAFGLALFMKAPDSLAEIRCQAEAGQGPRRFSRYCSDETFRKNEERPAPFTC